MKSKQDNHFKQNLTFQSDLSRMERDCANLRKVYNCYKYLHEEREIDLGLLLQEGRKLLKEILDFEKEHDLIKKFTVMNFSLLRLKIAILLGLMYMDAGDQTSADFVLFPACLTLIRDIKKLEFKTDYSLQYEINQLLDVLWLNHGENVTINPKPKMIIQLNIHAFSTLMATKCDSSFFKLKWLYHDLKSKILLNGKLDDTNRDRYKKYMNTFDNIKNEFKAAVDKKEVSWQALFDYLNSNIITFQFQLHTKASMRHSSINAAISNTDMDYINKYIKLHDELLLGHILPALMHFTQHFNLEKLKQNPGLLGHYCWTYSEFYQVLIDQFYILTNLNELLENDYKNPNKVLLEKQITNVRTATMYLLTFYQTPECEHPVLKIQLNTNIFHNQDEQSHPGYDSERMTYFYDQFVSTEEKNKHIYKLELELQEQIANKNAALLILQEEREKARKYKKKHRPKPVVETQSANVTDESNQSDSEEERDDIPTDPVKECMDNGLLMLKQKDYGKAIDYFLKAKSEAIWLNDHYQQLTTIDALTVAYSYVLRQNLDKILNTLNIRLRTTHPLSEDMQDEIQDLIYSVIERYDELYILYEDFLRVLEQITITNKTHDIIQEVTQGKETIYSLICSIKRKIEAIDQKNDELDKKKNTERQQYFVKQGTELIENAGNPHDYTPKELIALGKIKYAQLARKSEQIDGSANNHHMMIKMGSELIATPGTIADYNPDEISALGKIKFSQQGRIKRSNNSGQSLFTKEQHLVNELQTVFKDISQHMSTSLVNDPEITGPLQIDIQLTDQIKHLFHSLHEGSYEHYLVGSSAINILLELWGEPLINTDDYDFVTADIDARALFRMGFSQSKKMKKLHQGTVLGQKVDLYCEDLENNWLAKSLSRRHFTIAALTVAYDVANDNGYVIDPTGRGLDDLKEKCIRIIGNPLARLQEDPSIALAVIKYELLGFKIDDKLAQALLQLTLKKPPVEAHLNALLTKILAKADEFKVLEKLLHYGLLGTLFNLQHHGDSGHTLFALKKKISLTAPGLYINPNGFFSTSTNAVSTENPDDARISLSPNQ